MAATSLTCGDASISSRYINKFRHWNGRREWGRGWARQPGRRTTWPGRRQGANWPFHQPENIAASSPNAALATATALTSYSDITTTSPAAAESPRSPCTSGSGTAPEIPESPTCSAAHGPESPSQTAHWRNSGDRPGTRAGQQKDGEGPFWISLCAQGMASVWYWQSDTAARYRPPNDSLGAPLYPPEAEARRDKRLDQAELPLALADGDELTGGRTEQVAFIAIRRLGLHSRGRS